MSIARIAHAAEQSEDPQLDLALRAHATILKYVEPELKSVEVNVSQEDRRTIEVRLFEERDTPPGIEEVAQIAYVDAEMVAEFVKEE